MPQQLLCLYLLMAFKTFWNNILSKSAHFMQHSIVQDDLTSCVKLSEMLFSLSWRSWRDQAASRRLKGGAIGEEKSSCCCQNLQPTSASREQVTLFCFKNCPGETSTCPRSKHRETSFNTPTTETCHRKMLHIHRNPKTYSSQRVTIQSERLSKVSQDSREGAHTRFLGGLCLFVF